MYLMCVFCSTRSKNKCWVSTCLIALRNLICIAHLHAQFWWTKIAAIWTVAHPPWARVLIICSCSGIAVIPVMVLMALPSSPGTVWDFRMVLLPFINCQVPASYIRRNTQMFLIVIVFFLSASVKGTMWLHCRCPLCCVMTENITL